VCTAPNSRESDDDEISFSQPEHRKTRIGELIGALAAMRPCRRQGDAPLLQALEAELLLWLDKDLTVIRPLADRSS
jgi:hypothetical protein